MFWISWKILSLVFLKKNLKWKLILLLIFHYQSHIWQNSGSRVMGQPNCTILSNVISQEKWMMKFIYNMQMNIEIFYKLILSCSMCVTRHAQITQNKKFTYLCNISRKIWGIKLIFCLQINAKVLCKLIVSLWICLARHAQITQQSLQNLCNVSRKEWRVKLIFCM